MDCNPEDNDDLPSLKDVLSKNRKGYIFCHLNTRSRYRCIDEVHEFISVDGCDRLFLSFSLTWLDTCVPDGVIPSPGTRSLEEIGPATVEGYVLS